MVTDPTRRGVQAAQTGILVNAALAAIKLAAGIFGHTYALIADAVESGADVFGSLLVWGGLAIAARPPDADHPYGHGKAEALAAAAVALMLLGAAAGIAFEAAREIRTPHQVPAPWTLGVLAAVMLVKGLLSRRVGKVGAAFNAVLLIRPALNDLMDRIPGPEIVQSIRQAAETVPEVRAIEKLAVRKAGLGYRVNLHVQADPLLSLDEAHELSGRVKAAIQKTIPQVQSVLIHMEPFQGSAGASRVGR
jgi:divalent metal cation (Fe/Co/Zn/Cd) transporter